MRAGIHLGNAGPRERTTALIVYGTGRDALVSMHPVVTGPRGTSRLGTGVPVSEEFVRSLALDLSVGTPPEILPPGILFRSEGLLAWVTPPGREPMRFTALEAHHPNYRPEDVFTELDGAVYPHPALLWVLRGTRAELYALPSPDWPTAATELYVAPYLNVDPDTGWVCYIGTKTPPTARAADLKSWVEVFWESSGTRPLGSTPLTSHPGGFRGLWAPLKGADTFPVRYLVRTTRTVGSVLLRRTE